MDIQDHGGAAGGVPANDESAVDQHGCPQDELEALEALDIVRRKGSQQG